MTRLRIITLLLATITLTVACASLPPESGPARPEVSADGVQHITITVSNEMRFSPSRIIVRAGKPVALTLRNIGLMPHDLTLTDGTADPVTVTVEGGRTATTTFTLERTGTYRFVCSVPGHSDAGMQGTIVAEE